MKPAAEGVLQKWPVSKRINSSRTPGDDRSLIEPIWRHDPAPGVAPAGRERPI